MERDKMVSVEETTAANRGMWTTLARVISIAMHPLLMPFYALLLVLNGSTMMATLVPLRTKVFLIATFLLCTVIIPAMSVGLLRSLGRLNDAALDRRNDRIIPLLILLIMYCFCAWMLWVKSGDSPVFMTLQASIACVALALTVTPFWKISLHLIGAGGLFAVMMYVGVLEFRDFTGPMVVCTLLTGILAASRLWLGKHNPLQVAAGFIGGFTVSALVLVFL